jgi:DNA-directed RNA polymerase beta subunit
MDAIEPFLRREFADLRDAIHKAMIADFDLAREHVKSFNEFLRDGVADIIRGLPVATAQHEGRLFTMQFWNPVIMTPRVETHRKPPRVLTPDESKRRSSGYSGFLHVDVHIKEYKRPEDSFKRKIFAVDKDSVEEGCKLRFWTDLDLERPNAGGRLVAYHVYKDVRVVKLAMMTGSAGCNVSFGLGDEHSTRAEPGGDFLVRGAPKLVTGISRLADNFIFVVSNSKNAAQADIHCRSFERRYFSTTNLTLKLLLPNLKNATFGIAIRVFLPFIQKIVPLALMLRALGFTQKSFRKVLLKIPLADQIPDLDFKLDALFIALPSPFSVHDARVQLGLLANKSEHIPTRERLVHTAKYFLERSLFSHTMSFEAKGLLFARAVVKLFATTSVVNGRPLMEFDNKDDLVSKRYDTVGLLWTTLLRQVMSNHMNFISKHAEIQLKRSSENQGAFTCDKMLSFIDINAMSGRLNFALSTGQWSATRASQPVSRKNVCQLKQTQTYAASACHYGKITSGVNSEAKQKSLRNVQTRGLGKMDPSDTPDGKQCGLVSQLAFGVHIAHGVNDATILKALEPYLAQFEFVAVDRENVNPDRITADLFTLCFEHAVIGWLRNGLGLYRIFLALRRIGQINSEVSIVLHHATKEICILPGGSRLLSPLLAIDQRTVEAWQALSDIPKEHYAKVDIGLLETFGLVEYVEASETENTVVSMAPDDMLMRIKDTPNLRFTHMMLHPSMIFGISTATIPFAESNHAARTSFESVMAKQAIDSFMPVTLQATKNVLDNAQTALIPTRMSKVSGGLTTKRGQIVKLGIFPSGGDQEDAVDVCKSSIERGAFAVTRFRPERDQQSSSNKGFTGEQFECPDPKITIGMQYSPIDHLMSNGLAQVGSVLQCGHIAIGKTAPLRSNKRNKKTTAATAAKSSASTTGTGTAGTVAQDVEVGFDVNADGHTVKPSKRDQSLIYQGNDAVVCKSTESSTLAGEKTRKIETRQAREVQIGDKLDAHSQKSTVARIVPQEDLPWSLIDGTVCDLYAHPISLLARRTGGYAGELFASRVFCIRPSQVRKLLLFDGTPFAVNDRRRDQEIGGKLLHDAWLAEFEDLLADVRTTCQQENGSNGSNDSDGYIPFYFPKTGKEPFMCGKTGRKIDCMVFVGLIEMHRLLQFVMDKFYAAYTAQKTILLQYRGGRADLGGMRVGTMEVDVFAAHGVAFILFESLVTLADPVDLYFCPHCGVMCLVVVDSRSSCGVCQREGVAVVLHTVEGFRSFLFNVASLGILCKLDLTTVSSSSASSVSSSSSSSSSSRTNTTSRDTSRANSLIPDVSQKKRRTNRPSSNAHGKTMVA